ncbi:pentapeptide repeat-containing protein (plasmid) [Arthrobacter sp. Z1-9]
MALAVTRAEKKQSFREKKRIRRARIWWAKKKRSRGWWVERPILFTLVLAAVFAFLYSSGFFACVDPAFSGSPVCKNAMTQPWATISAGTLVLLGAILTYLSTEKTRALTREELNQTKVDDERSHHRQLESALNDRFVKAVEQLGNKDQNTVKLGGVYSLMALAEDWVSFGLLVKDSRKRARKQAQVCVDVLTAYLKSNTHLIDQGSVKTLEEGLRQEIFRLLIATRGPKDAKDRHVLRWTKLNLEGADMTGAKLEELVGENIDLSGALLVAMDLTSSNWNFFGSFQGARLDHSRFSFADLRGVCMENAWLIGTNFELAKVHQAHFDGAHLGGTDFSSAHGLTSEQVKSAHCWNADTKWPESFIPDPPMKPHAQDIIPLGNTTNNRKYWLSFPKNKATTLR